MADAEPDGRRREHEARPLRVREILVDVRLDVDRRAQGRAAVGRPDDPAHVDVDVDHAVAVRRERPNIGRLSPRGVPVTPSVDVLEGLDALERAVTDADEVSPLGPDEQSPWGWRQAGAPQALEARDVGPRPVFVGVAERVAIDDRPPARSVPRDRNDVVSAEAVELDGPRRAELVESPRRADEDLLLTHAS